MIPLGMTDCPVCAAKAATAEPRSASQTPAGPESKPPRVMGAVPAPQPQASEAPRRITHSLNSPRADFLPGWWPWALLS
jgi:hypothetical protein